MAFGIKLDMVGLVRLREETKRAGEIGSIKISFGKKVSTKSIQSK